MTDKEVLQKAIEKVTTLSIKEGMDRVVIAGENMYVSYGLPKNEAIKRFMDENMIAEYEDIEFLNIWHVKGFTLSEAFAKHFWGEGDNDQVCKSCDHYVSMDKLWQYHLQQMVLEPNPIDYLRKFVDNTEKSVIEQVKPLLREIEKLHHKAYVEIQGTKTLAPNPNGIQLTPNLAKGIVEATGTESILGLKTREIEVTSKPTYLSGVFSNKMSFSFKGGIERNDVVHFKGVEYLVSDITRVEGRDDVARVMAIEIECDIKDLKLEVGDKLTYKTI